MKEPPPFVITISALTGQNSMDARQYHLCLDTSAVGLEVAEEIILNYFRARVGEKVP
jgi:hypothetical protein